MTTKGATMRKLVYEDEPTDQARSIVAVKDSMKKSLLVDPEKLWKHGYAPTKACGG